MSLRRRILILCTGNACRSQMAEGYLRHFGGGRIAVRSAGIESHGLNPRAVRVMREDGIDISGHSSDTVNAAMLEWCDCVITVCSHADTHCPHVPAGVEKRHIGFADPAKAGGSDDEIMNAFREVRDQIRGAMLNVALALEKQGPV